MTFKTLRVQSSDQITTVTLNRPSARNSLTTELMVELRELVDQLRGDETTRAVIVTGAGRIFSVGADVEMLTRIGETYTPEARPGGLWTGRASALGYKCRRCA